MLTHWHHWWLILITPLWPCHNLVASPTRVETVGGKRKRRMANGRKVRMETTRTLDAQGQKKKWCKKKGLGKETLVFGFARSIWYVCCPPLIDASVGVIFLARVRVDWLKLLTYASPAGMISVIGPVALDFWMPCSLRPTSQEYQ